MEAIDVSTNYYALTLFKMCIVGVVHFWAAKSPLPSSLKFVTHMLQWWNVAHFTLPKEDTNHVTYPWVLLTSVFFRRKLANFPILRNTDISWKHFGTFQSLKIVLLNMVTILIMSVKIATLVFLKIKVFWNKCYHIIVFTYYVPNEILSCDSNFIVDVVM